MRNTFGPITVTLPANPTYRIHIDARTSFGPVALPGGSARRSGGVFTHPVTDYGSRSANPRPQPEQRVRPGQRQRGWFRGPEQRETNPGVPGSPDGPEGPDHPVGPVRLGHRVTAMATYQYRTSRVVLGLFSCWSGWRSCSTASGCSA